MKVVSRYQELVTGGPEGCQGWCEGEDNVLHSRVTRAEKGVVHIWKGSRICHLAVAGSCAASLSPRVNLFLTCSLS